MRAKYRLVMRGRQIYTLTDAGIGFVRRYELKVRTV